MAVVLPWLDQNWFTLVQTAGIIGSVLLSGAAMRRDRRARRIGDHLTLAGHHHELWSDMHRWPELACIARAEVDLIAQPISVVEEEFLLLVIVHFHTGWMLAKAGSLLTLPVLAQDARSFFALPIPQAVWKGTMHTRDPQFVRFVERVLNTHTESPRICL